MKFSDRVYKKEISRKKTISGQLDRASITETVDMGSIPGRSKQKTVKLGIYSFSAWRSAIKGTEWSLHMCDRQVAAWLENRKVPSLSPGQGILVNKCDYNITI